MVMDKKIQSELTVLASASPRRLQILRSLGISPRVFVPQVEEISTGKPAEIVIKNALSKAQAAAAKFNKHLIIAADTIVVKDGQVLGKPQDEAQAGSMLAFLSGAAHEVYSSIALIDTAKGRQTADYGMTKVFFRTLSREDIAAYIATQEPLDKAGAYGIQGLGSIFVERIEGDHGTVVGLSPFLLAQLLARLDKKIF
ncbi:MAG: Maf family protein [Bacillota bacterium]|jgi:septum formation protein